MRPSPNPNCSTKAADPIVMTPWYGHLGTEPPDMVDDGRMDLNYHR